jgi:hypothetical protein
MIQGLYKYVTGIYVPLPLKIYIEKTPEDFQI